MTGHIYIYGEIGTKTGQVSLQNVKSQIDKDADSYVVHIFSPGGDVFEGYGIYNAIKNNTNGKPVETHIEGLCASIATLVAASGQKIIMNRTGQFMIHNPHISDLKGDANELRNVANQLDQIKSILIGVYKARTKLSDEKLWALYDNETYLTADQAMQMGFIDESVEAIKAVAYLDLKQFKMETKPTLLASIRNFFSPKRFEQFKNEFTETLTDGRVIIVMSDDEDWTNKPVVYEDGSAVPTGSYQLQSGKTIDVADGGIITQVNATPVEENKKEIPGNTETTEMENKRITELENQLKEALAQLEQANAGKQSAEQQAATAQNQVGKFEAKMKDFDKLQKEFLALKEDVSKTFGENKDLSKGPVFKNASSVKDFDPMGEELAAYYHSRNIIIKK